MRLHSAVTNANAFPRRVPLPQLRIVISSGLMGYPGFCVTWDNSISHLAAVIAFLGSPCSSYLTGATLQVDGGVRRGLL
jgi:NAD(P)-dependent dehydrogenase (short-subunit alcohol dehydrogenase family)